MFTESVRKPHPIWIRRHVWLAAVVLNCGFVCRGQAQEVPSGADLVVLNATVITVDDQRPTATALAIGVDRFLRVGDNSDVESLIGPDTSVIDANGKTIVPGFNDAHLHPGPLFDELSPFGRVDCGPQSVHSIEELIARLKLKVEVTPAGQWVHGFGYQDTKLGRHPTREDLDRASIDHPIYISHSSGHVAAVNSLALENARVTEETPDPRGGQFDRDADGRPNGVLRESAKSIVRNAGPDDPAPTDEQWLAGIQRQFDEYLRHGITSVQQAGTSPETLQRYAAAQSHSRQVRLYVMLRFGHLEALKDLVAASGRGDAWLRIGAVKHFHGNSLSGRTCWLYEPYHDRPNYYGIPPADSQEELNRKVMAIHAAGMQACIHSNGDREIDMVLNAYEQALGQMPRDDHRHRIEHASVVNERILERVKELGIVLATHSYIYEHGDKMEAYGPQRWPWMHPNGSAIRMGIPVAGNSDSPVSAARPLLRIQSMVTRQSAEGKVYGSEQRVSVDDAIRIWTLGSAYASFEDEIKGSITPGKLADFVLLSDDPRAVPADEIKDIDVEMTVVGGQIAFRRVGTAHQ